MSSSHLHQSAGRSPRKNSSKNLLVGKLSGPFVKDTSIIIEKFVESVKDLFQYCYTDKDLYADIHRMSDEELFANLSEYLEEIKFSIFEALSQNLDKLSMKFLQLCDSQEKFNKYLRVLKEKWRKSSAGFKSTHRHDDRYIKSAKEYINRLADEFESTSKKRSRSPIKPQFHMSEFGSASARKNNLGKNSRGANVKAFQQDVPLTKEFSSAAGGKPASQLNQTNGSVRPSVSSRSRSRQRRERVEQAAEKEQFSLIQSRDEYQDFIREIIDPFTGRKL